MNMKPLKSLEVRDIRYAIDGLIAIYERLVLPLTYSGSVEILAEFSAYIANNNLLKPYINRSKSYSLRIILRLNELYDISLHEVVRNKLKDNKIELNKFNKQVTNISNILDGKGNIDVRDYYLPHAHKTMIEVVRFLLLLIQ